MDDLFHELNLYLEPSVAANMGNSAEQNTAALIASSMNSEYEDDWSTPASSYRDSHTPLTNSSVSSNSADQKLGFGDNLLNHQLVHNGSSLSSIEAEEAVLRGFNNESLPLLTFNEYEEIRNYTDLDLLEAAAPTLLNEVNAVSQPDPIITPVNQEFESNDITNIKGKQKMTPSKKKNKQVPDATKQLKAGQAALDQSALEVNEEGGFMGFNEESLRKLPPPVRKKKKKPVQKQPVTNITQIQPPDQLAPGIFAQPNLCDSTKLVNEACDPTILNHSYPESSQTFFKSDTSQMKSENSITALDSKIQEVNMSGEDIWTTESPKKDGNILKKKFVKKSLPHNPLNCETSNSPVKKPMVLKPTRKETPLINPESKVTPKAPSYLTLFPMRCKEYPMIYSCNHCAGIFTSIRAGQLHDCVKKRRGRKAGTKLQQSYSGNFCDWTLV
uniref:Protein translocase subunit SecA 1 n=1 Tax=Lygus hesperus TaxID=30085 RepID=A0A0A9Z1A6_LYGHE